MTALLKPLLDWKFQCPRDWHIVQQWGNGWACQSGGLRAIIDCSVKADGEQWLHLSISRKDWDPTHFDMCKAKTDFLENRYAYSVFPPAENYVNIHSHCLHLWARLDGEPVLPEFSEMLKGIGRSI